MIWFHLHQNTPRDWKNNSRPEDWVPIDRGVLIKIFESAYRRMNGEKVHYLLYSSLYQKKGSSWRYTSNIWLNRLRNLNVGICNIGRILIYARCREMDKAYSFLTIKCMMNRRIDSVGINNRVVPSVSEIVVGRWTVRFLFLHRCFLREYLAWWIVE